VARCAQHPFFSFDDWFIGSTACDAGVPQAIADLTVQFNFNDLASAERVFAEHPGAVACLILEPAASEEPAPGFLEGLEKLCRANGAVFILDEMITGFRWHLGGAQAHYGVTPDLSTFGKAIGNGFSMAALVGKRELMELGGLEHDRERVFLISTTHGAESIGLAATRATVEVFQSENVISHLWNTGRRLIDGFNAVSREFGVESCVRLDGVGCSPQLVCRDRSGAASPVIRTLFMQEMIQRGVLMPYVAISLAHTAAIVDRTLEALRGAMPVLRDGLDGAASRLLVGPAVRPVFRAFNHR
jgi:glutamate-1-semialdehyde 2,1-aminomutase